MNRKDYRRFMRHLRASDMKPFRKTGCDMGWYGHFKGPVKTDPKKLAKARKMMLEEMEKYT